MILEIQALRLLSLRTLLTVSLTCSLLCAQQTKDTQAASKDDQDFNPAHIERTYTSSGGVHLDELLWQLQSTYLIPVNFEEVAYENSSELVSKDIMAVSGPKHLLFAPRSDFSVTIGADKTQAIDAVKYLIDQHSNAGLSGSGAYQVIKLPSRIEVSPYRVLGANGSWHSVSPITTNVRVSIPESERTFGDTIDILAAEISRQSGKQVQTVVLPNPTLKVVFGAEGVSPGDLLEQLGTKFKIGLSYHLRFDPTRQLYMLSIYTVSDPKVRGTLKNNPTPGSNAPTQPSPPSFFKKTMPETR